MDVGAARSTKKRNALIEGISSMKWLLVFAALVTVSLIFPGCVTSDFVNPDGSTTRTRTIDVAQARDILLFAIQAFDLVTARIAAYEAQGQDLSEPDALQLAIAQARETFLRRGIDFLNREFDQLNANENKIRVPVGLFRQVGAGIQAETGVPLRMSTFPRERDRPGIKFSFSARPAPGPIVSPNNEPWRFHAAGFSPTG